jgi:hypothetical protein
LGVLNSALITFRLRHTSTPFRGGYLALNRQYIEGIPLIPPPTEPANLRSGAERIQELVQRMLELNARPEGHTAHEQAARSRQIAATDREIDQLVYQLYGLTDEEIRIVEESIAAVTK